MIQTSNFAAREKFHNDVIIMALKRNAERKENRNKVGV